MALPTGTHSYSTVLAYTTTTPGAYTDLTYVKNVGGPEIAAKDADATHLKSPSAYKEYLAGLIEQGELDLTAIYDKTQYAALLALIRTMKTWKLTLPDSSILVCHGYLKSLGKDVPEDDVITNKMKIKLTGLPVFTPG